MSTGNHFNSLGRSQRPEGRLPGPRPVILSADPAPAESSTRLRRLRGAEGWTMDTSDDDRARDLATSITEKSKQLLTGAPLEPVAPDDAKPAPGENDAGKGAPVVVAPLDAQIRAAQEAGDAKELVRLKNQKLFAPNAH